MKGVSPFVTLCFVGALAAFSATIVRNPVLPLFTATLGVDDATLGLIASVSAATGVLVGFPAGVLSDMVGRRRVMLLGILLFAVTPLLYLFVTTPGQLVVVRIIHGAGTAILNPVVMAVVAETYSADRGERMAWYSSIYQVGRFVAPTAGGLLIVGHDFTWVFIVSAMSGFLALLAFFALKTTSGSTGTTTHSARAASWANGLRRMGSELRLVTSHRGILLTSLMEAAQYFSIGAVETFLPLYLISVGFSAWEIGPIFTAQLVATAIAKPGLGRLSDRLGRRRFIAAGLLVGASAVAAMPVTTNYWAVLALSSLFGVTVAAVTGCTSALVSDFSRSSAYGSSLGILNSIKDVGHGAGPAVAGFLVMSWSYGSAFAVVGGVMTVGALAFYLLVSDPAPTN
ncbi:MAG: MFS transporter [Chloroflexota bacterium]|nr:MFS transporter [Chloroflexota bacterium]